MKDTFYFTHDYNTRSDSKVTKLLAKHGMRGYGLFWSIIEDLYNNANVLRLDYDCLAYALREDVEVIKSVIHDFDLFVFEDDNFGSKSVQQRLEERNAKSEKARKSAIKRWTESERNANALQTQYDGNAIKESKVNEINESKENDLNGSEKPNTSPPHEPTTIPKQQKKTKEEEFDLRRANFRNEVYQYNNEYHEDMLNSFLMYWGEKTISGHKMKWELQKTFEIRLRLRKWKENQNKFSKPEEQRSLRAELK
jgi:hypothetical protein